MGQALAATIVVGLLGPLVDQDIERFGQRVFRWRETVRSDTSGRRAMCFREAGA